jgi:altronate dehydratase small subunit
MLGRMGFRRGVVPTRPNKFWFGDCGVPVPEEWPEVGDLGVAMKVNAIRIDPADNVAVALRDIECGEAISGSVDIYGEAIEPIPSGHKVAVEEIDSGASVRRYGETIGKAAALIRPGQHVHTHNIQGMII